MSFLFGGDTPQVQNTFANASGGGLTTKFDNGYKTTADPTRTAAVSDLANTYSDLGNETAGLRAGVAPGFNDLLASQLGSINNSAHAAIGNLQQNLQSRRILGSSFGNDTLSRAQAEFSKQRADTTANNFLQSLQANNQLLQQEYQARTQAANTGLNELNLEAGTANGLIGSTNSIMAQNAQANAKLQADSQAGAGKFLGNLIGQFGGSSLGGMFGGSSSGSNGTLASLSSLGSGGGPIASPF